MTNSTLLQYTALIDVEFVAFVSWKASVLSRMIPNCVFRQLVKWQ